uniref:Uncharacterized protein n=1 Tax=Aegilops tauschii subsp. strangulata TaxID=200361 RepID=A0A453CG51_AEGTS
GEWAEPLAVPTTAFSCAHRAPLGPRTVPDARNGPKILKSPRALSRSQTPLPAATSTKHTLRGALYCNPLAPKPCPVCAQTPDTTSAQLR